MKTRFRMSISLLLAAALLIFGSGCGEMVADVDPESEEVIEEVELDDMAESEEEPFVPQPVTFSTTLFGDEIVFSEHLVESGDGSRIVESIGVANYSKEKFEKINSDELSDFIASLKFEEVLFTSNVLMFEDGTGIVFTSGVCETVFTYGYIDVSGYNFTIETTIGEYFNEGDGWYYLTKEQEVLIDEGYDVPIIILGTEESSDEDLSNEEDIEESLEESE